MRLRRRRPEEGADQRQQGRADGVRNEAGRAEGTAPGPAWSWSARGIHARGASPASSSGSDARRRDAIMTYPRLARPQNPGHLCYVAARDRRRSDGRSRRSIRRLRCTDRSVERYVNASSSAVGISGTYDLLRCPHVEPRPHSLVVGNQEPLSQTTQSHRPDASGPGEAAVYRRGCPSGPETSIRRRDYCPGPLTVNSSRVESFLPSPVQIAPSAAQFWVTGRTTVTSPLESGSTVISHRMLLGLSSRWALRTSPPDTVNAKSLRVL